MKVCRHCLIAKPLTAFTTYALGKDGVYYYCRECLKELRKERARKKVDALRQPLESGVKVDFE